MAELRAAWVLGNNYLAHLEPWKKIKTDPGQAALIIRIVANLIRLFAVLSRPVLPEAAHRLATAFVDWLPDWTWPTAVTEESLTLLKPGQKIALTSLLFQKIEEARVKRLIHTYGGANRV